MCLVYEETEGPEKTHAGTGRTCKAHICRHDLYSHPKPFFPALLTTISACADSNSKRTKNEIKGRAFQLRSTVSRNHQGEKLGDQAQVSITGRQFKVKRWFRWQYVPQSLSMLNEKSEAHQHLTICAPD